MDAMIEVAQLTKSYGKNRGVVNLEFTIPSGQVFGFLGPNGAGKTTTIRLLMALLRADSGSARIAGLDCWKDSLAVKRLTGYVPGEPSLDPNLTGGQILTYFSHLRGTVDQQYLQSLIERLDLDTGHPFHQYSTGNKRKVVLIQAFMHRPRVLILDEPTGGLDPLNQQAFALMVREAIGWGATVLLSSHILSEVEELCDEVAIIREGRLARVGRVAEIKDIKRQQFTLVFAAPVPTDAFATLPGVTRIDVADGGRTLHVSVQGTPDAVVKAAAQHPVVSLSSYEPSLEDIFLHYFDAGDPPAGATSDVA